jgi:hypothetical protein
MPTFDITGLLAVREDHRVIHEPAASPHQPLVLLVEVTDADCEPVEHSLSIGDGFRPSDFATVAAAFAAAAAAHGRDLERSAKL